MLNEAKTSRPRPEQRGRGWGWGQCLEVEAKAEAKKYQIVINNIRFEIIAGKINKIPEFNTIFAWKMPDYIIRQRDRGQAEAKFLRPRPRPNSWGQGQSFEAEAKSLRPRPKFWPRCHKVLTSLPVSLSLLACCRHFAVTNILVNRN